MTRESKSESAPHSTSPWKQALVDAGLYRELRWHYQHGRRRPHESAGTNNKWARIHKVGKVRRVKPPWKM